MRNILPKVYPGWLYEIAVLILFCFIACLYCYDRLYFPSMDGPAHLHNSLLLKEYFNGNSVVRQNFELTPFYIPNLFSNYLLAGISLLFSPLSSLYCFFFLFYFIYLYSAYYLLKSYEVRFAGLTAVAFSIFFNSELLNLGFYNFSWSMAFLFFGLGHYKRSFINTENFKWSAYIVYAVLLFFMYYSNALTFIFFGLFVLAVEVIKLLNCLRAKQKINISHALKLLLFASPFVIMLFVFYSNSFLNNATGINNYTSLSILLINFSSIIIYSFESEKSFTSIIFALVMFLFIYNLAHRFAKDNRRIEYGDIFLAIALFMLYLYYTVWDHSSADMMSARLQYYFFLFLLVWLTLQKQYIAKIIVAVSIAALSFSKYVIIQKDVMKDLESGAKAISAASGYIEKNATVTGINYSGVWLMVHFTDYLGIEKPMIITDNYEASVRWFPLTWKKNVTAIKFENTFILKMQDNPEKFSKVDYVMVYGDVSKLKENPAYMNELTNHYKMIYKSTDNYVELYKLAEL